jgi:hypothetical protein
MANTRFQHKRSTTSGVVPTTSDIAAGELGLNLADRRIFTSNGSAVFELGSNLTSLAVSGNVTIGSTGDVVFTPGAGIFANGSVGTAGQVLHSNGSSVYWDTDDQGVTSVATGVGLTGGTITTTGTVSVLANNGITANSTGLFVTQGTGAVVNSTGVHVNAAYIATIAANSATGSLTNTFTVGTAAYFVANGNLGIGTASPDTTLNVVANTTSDAVRITQTGIGNALVVEDSASPDTTPFVVSAAGRVGIGTSNPGTTLDVRGSIDAASSALSRVRITMSGGVGSIVSENAGTQFEELRQTSQFASFYTGLSVSTESMRIDAGGNVGIANTAPNARLAVTGTANISGNVVVGGSLNAANVTSTVFTGSLTGTSSNATNLNGQPASFYTNASNIITGTLPMAQLGSNVVNTTGAFTISGIYTHTANIVMGNTTVNTQHSNSTILISNSTTTTTVGLTDIRLGNSTVNTFINASGLTTAANVLINATGELVISPGAGIFANGSLGAAGQVLSSNATSVYWASPSAPPGGELFNINVSNATGYAVTAFNASAYVAPATAGLQYVVHSIQVTNISAANATISGEIQGTTYANTSFALTVPVPRESAVELLKMPKVLQPNGIIRLQASTGSALHAYITVESISSTAFFGAGVDVTADATFTDLHTATGNSVITSVLLANDDGVNDVKARVVWTDGANAIQGYLCFDMIVPADATVELLEKVKYLPSGHKIRVYANVGGRLEAIIAGRTL